jgi:tRNA(adenine34) deaminase
MSVEEPAPSAHRPDDAMWMARALEQARLASTKAEVPVGAVLVLDNKLLAEGHNLTISTSDPSAHAEVVTLRKAGKRVGDWRLTNSTLYVTLEPCAMCAGALVLARVGRVVFGPRDPKAGMVRSLGSLLEDARLNHRAEVTEGVLASQGADLLRSFFRALRS